MDSSKVLIMAMMLAWVSVTSSDPVNPLAIPVNADIIVSSFIGGPKDEIDFHKQKFRLDINAPTSEEEQKTFREDANVFKGMMRMADAIGSSTRKTFRNMLKAALPEVFDRNEERKRIRSRRRWIRNAE